jgi:3-methyladenine DNA glycosylase AlkC
MSEQKRKGARSIKDIPADIMQQLNAGKIETANLVEWLAIDQRLLLKNFLISEDRFQYLDPILKSIDNLKKLTVNTLNETIGTELMIRCYSNQDGQLLQKMATHTSDCIRCWTTYTVGKNPNLSVQSVFEYIQPFAADKHFGVREIAWMAVRPIIACNLEESIHIFTAWASHSDENIRRFASESTRPRGVWCAHIEVLKQNPSLALPILELLNADKSRYVQDSVGNWLNDASKTQPQFVADVCADWTKANNGKETAYIVKKALRSL